LQRNAFLFQLLFFKKILFQFSFPKFERMETN
jgi:hypothetical protein